MKSVVFIGAGNIATSLAFAFKNAGWNIVQVYSRTVSSASHLANMVGAAPVVSFDDIATSADVYIIAIPDQSIPDVLDGLKKVSGVVVHTSGSTPMEVLSEVGTGKYGVFYPFQTFSRSKRVDLSDVPIFVEANTNNVLNFLVETGNELSNRVSVLTSENRVWLHVAGVFAGNFTNHILALTYKLAVEHGIAFNVVEPLVEETVKKAFTGNPKDFQTGPAIRNDNSTVRLHSTLLNDFDEQLQKIYNELSLSIQKFSKQ